MLYSRALLAPALPTLLLDEHRRDRTPMLEALAAESERLYRDPPEVVFALSARWVSDGPFFVDVGARHRTLTDYIGLGVEVRYDSPGHPTLARALIESATAADVRIGPAERGVDSGVTIPMHFLFPRPGMPVVPLSLAEQSDEACRAFGAAIRAFATARPERILFVIGGALSFDEHAWNFRREVPEAIEFDAHVLRVLREGDWNAIGEVSHRVWDRARPHARLRHLEVMRGFLGADLPGEVAAHESHPGLGAALVSFEVPEAPRLPVE
ncbi:MAG: hypothetical protein HOP12_05860 [Candidatus Eisenbacteria bacterium]|uniref:Extradiol ring-cleavage dioxygenase class III enzyme subunit B domain-containing protein n=1 Tax=Eiseniibacteriota bacterium TaxID=2212470 RepID=A0A849SE83_UNCEI|nr:hypothetical protein [Candidatus Eisenbacteria bacterium]